MNRDDPPTREISRLGHTELESMALVSMIIPSPIFVFSNEGDLRYINDSAEQHFPEVKEHGIDTQVIRLLWEQCKLLMQSQDDQLKSIVKVGERYFQQVTTHRKDAFYSVMIDITDHQRTLHELHNKQAKFRALFNNAGEAIWLLDMQDGTMAQFNDVAHEYLGYTREEFATLTIRDIEAVESPEQIKERLDTIRRECIHVFETVHRTKTGELRNVILNVRYLSLDEKHFVLCVIRDITEQRQAEIALRESEEKFRAISAFALEAIFMINPEGKIVYCNKAAEQIFGRDQSEILGEDPHKILMPKRYEDQAKQGFQKFSQTGTGNHLNRIFELTAIRKNGSEFPIEIAVVPFHKNGNYWATAVIRDISARKQAEQTIIDKAKQTQQYLDTTQVMLVALDREGNITLVNKRGLEILGYARQDELIGQNWFKTCLPKKAREQVSKVFANYMTGDIGQAEDYENHILCKNGQERVISWRNALLTDRQGIILGVLSSGEDITEHKIQETERLLLEKQFQEAQKYEALGVLTGGIAHDFNNLLAAILGNADLILLDLPPRSAFELSLNEIVAAAKRAAELCRLMLSYAGKSLPEKQIVSFSDTVKSTTKLLLRGILSPNIQLQVNLADKPLFISADETQIQQILMNLLTNAIETVGNARGLIRITTGVKKCSSQYLARAVATPNIPSGVYAFLEVTDSGCGMSEATIIKIFDPFFTTKFTGRGLGLSAVLGIIRNHGGAIMVSSEPNQGTTFRLLLPLYEHSETQITPNKTQTPTTWQGQGLILLIEDNGEVITVAKKMLNRLGFKVIIASDGEEAIRLFSKFQNEIVAIVLDYLMPNMDGKELLDRWSRDHTEIPPVIITSGCDRQTLDNEFATTSIQPVAILYKPYAVNELVEALKRILD